MPRAVLVAAGAYIDNVQFVGVEHVGEAVVCRYTVLLGRLIGTTLNHVAHGDQVGQIVVAVAFGVAQTDAAQPDHSHLQSHLHILLCVVCCVVIKVL